MADSSLGRRFARVVSRWKRGIPERMSVENQLAKMRRDWDARARENARHYIASERESWSDEEFYASGESSVAAHILDDMGNVCQGKDPKTMRVLEIGCGAGRMTRALARLFGEVHGVDVSGEMVRLAREALGPFANAFVYQNNGFDLSVIPAAEFDFAFSHLVFQHIPGRDVIRNYVREVHRLLRPGALFKFQVHGDVTIQTTLDNTWVGTPFSDEQVVGMAAECGFEARYRYAAGEQEFWVWYFNLPR